MINFHIAFDENDGALGDYFRNSKLDIANFIAAECANPIVHEIGSARCNQAYIDVRLPQINTQNYLFIAYSHGSDDSLLSAGSFFVKKDVNSALFINSFFYAMCCFTARELGSSLIASGCHGYIGYNTDASAFFPPHDQLCIDCDNHGLKNFIRGVTLVDCFTQMKDYFTQKIDELENDGQTLLAALLLSNREALEMHGNANLRLSDFDLN